MNDFDSMFRSAFASAFRDRLTKGFDRIASDLADALRGLGALPAALLLSDWYARLADAVVELFRAFFPALPEEERRLRKQLAEMGVRRLEMVLEA